MPGVRIHHPSARSKLVVVPHPGDVNGRRKPKDYRVRVDANGDAIVSETVWRRLEEARASGCSLHPFLILNEVGAPPATLIDLRCVAPPEPGVVIHDAHSTTDLDPEALTGGRLAYAH